MNDYKVVEESGLWYLSVNGRVARNAPHFHPEHLMENVRNLEREDRLWEELFVLERKVNEAIQPMGWPYGAVCEKHESDEGPLWILTEPYRADEYSIRRVNPDPTGLIPVGVYDRNRYEVACGVLDIAPLSDEQIKPEFSQGGRNYDCEDVLAAAGVRMAFRRSIGIHVEEMEDLDRRTQILEDAGLLREQFTRDEYETACEIMGVKPLLDSRVLLLVTINAANDHGVCLTTPGLPNDPVSISLAYSRALGIRTTATAETGDKAE